MKTKTLPLKEMSIEEIYNGENQLMKYRYIREIMPGKR